jgi:ABC-2 type transport system permease protein
MTRLEFMLFVRNGEQLVINALIPVAALITLCLTRWGDLGQPRANGVVPAILAVAVMSSAFTGQAIAVGFDRRYGALKRLGATMAPAWAIIAAKSGAVTAVVALQAVLLGSIGALLGWRPTAPGLAITVGAIAIGAAAFAAMGLLLGGSLRAEIVLPLANLLWFLQIAACGLAAFTNGSSGWLSALVALTPSGALATALHHGTAGRIDVAAVGVLVVWGALAALLARKTFRFT